MNVRFFFVVWCFVCTEVCGKKDHKAESNQKKDEGSAKGTPSLVGPSPTFPNKLDCPLHKSSTCLKNPDNYDRPFCASFRGNGAAIFVHFVSLARLVELLGPVHGFSGGSSGAVVSFITESMQMSPFVRICGDRCCTLEEQIVRLSFMLKSTEVVADLLDPILVGLLDYSISSFPDEIQNLINAIGTDDFSKALVDLAVALADPAWGFARLVNPEFIKLLANDVFSNQAALVPRILDIVDVLTNDFNSRADTDPLVTVRVFLISYPRAIAKIDTIGSFYAGLEPLDIVRFSYLIEQCAVPEIVLGKQWDEIGRHRIGNGQTCRELFRELFFDFINSRDETHPRRMEDLVGAVIPTFVSTGVLTGDTFDLWKQATIDYVKHPSLADFSNPNFDDFRNGYFGDKVSLERAAVNLPQLYPNDFKTERFLDLGQDTWEEVMVATSSEPTLAKGIILDEEKKWVSVGGWNDVVSTNVLQASGCDNVISINGAGGSFPFPLEISIGLGATPEVQDTVFGFDEFATPSNSSFALSLEAQDGVVCIPWKKFGVLDIQGPLTVTYDSDFMSRDACLQSLGAISPRNAGVGEANFGCVLDT